ncbi:ParA family protein [candidate division KSB1 bacterium]
MYKIAIVNQKGGVAKTTTAINLASEISRMGHKVLLIDLDAQFSATSSIFGNTEFGKTIYDVIVKKIDIKKTIQKASNFGFDVVTSDIMLSAADLLIIKEIAREKILLNQIRNLKYDMIIMDCPPSLGLVTVNALIACEAVLIPVCPEYFSLKGIKLLEQILLDVEKMLLSKTLLKSVLITRYRDRVVTREAEQAIREYYGRKVFETVIPENIKIEEAHNAHLPVYKYNKTCKGSIAYRNLSKEVLEWVDQKSLR